MQVYPELGSGCFVVIADFENPIHMELIRLDSDSDRAKCRLDSSKGRAETGSGCLRSTIASAGDTIVISNQGASNWYLKRDWREYDLLLMSIRSPVARLSASISVTGGSEDERSITYTSITLDRGWNVVRLDLASIGENIPLDDVREILVGVSGASKPVEIILDDILLAANRADLLGDSAQRNKGLYVRRAGRRWKVGASGHGAGFELTFANGEIIEWFQTDSDPHHLRNLLGRASLGPRPVVVGEPGSDEVAAATPGQAVVVQSKIVEMNSVRAVVASEWRFGDDAEAVRGSPDDRPFQRWTYTIYPTGQLYVGVEATAATKTWQPPNMGLAVTLASTPGDEFRIHSGSASMEETSAPVPAYATAHRESGGALLLYAVAGRADRAVRMLRSDLQAGGESDAADYTSLVAVADQGERAEHQAEAWACHIFLASAGGIQDEEVRARVADYARPAAPRIEIGSLVASTGPYGGEDGFDPSTGCHVIAPDGDLVRFVVDGRRRPRLSPVFRIVDTADREAWVYIDHLEYDRVARDALGNLVFQLPGTVRDSTMVEVHLRPGKAGE